MRWRRENIFSDTFPLNSISSADPNVRGFIELNEYAANSAIDAAVMKSPFPDVASLVDRPSLHESNVSEVILRLALSVDSLTSIYRPPPYSPAMHERNCSEVNVSR